ncbi:MAG: hypothetical protein LBL95_01890 [Deltaproteobacteria bacterium]|jgi:hypothetical protein|nr:hypothetical protein [Deltaproteobacteria bacterium]
MDLAAFLAPGVYPVFMAGGSLDGEPWGHVLSRPGGRVSWLAREPALAGESLFLTLKVPGYHLGADGSLFPAVGLELGAWVVLSGEVMGCRLVQERRYLLRLAGLVRVLD